jgi:hypothetical protein
MHFAFTLLQMTLIQPDLDMQAIIRKELNENVNTTQSDLQHIKDWLAKQPHLPIFEGEMFSDKVFCFEWPHLNHCRSCTPASEDGLKESPKHVRQK